MTEKKSKRNFWIAFTPIILISVCYSAYMVYSHKAGLNDDFSRRSGLVMMEEQIQSAQMVNEKILSGKDVIAIVKENTNILEEMKAGRTRNKSNDKYYWRAIVMLDPELIDWKFTVKEEEVKPARVCQGVVLSSTLEVKDYRCFAGKI